MNAPARRLRVEQVMGTVVTVDVRPPLCDENVLDEVVGWFHTVDERFSTYHRDSEVSRLSRGEITVAQAHPDVREVLDLCVMVRERSGGAFDERRGAGLDPSAVVKGWSVDRAVALLEHAGARNLCVNAGGDVVVRGRPDTAPTWRVGVRHPDRADRVAAVLEVTDLAVATSGAYERGGHIVDPRTGGRATGVRSMTVVGPVLALADAYSTAAYVMGRDGAAWVTAQPGYGVLAVTDDDRTVYDDTVAAMLVGRAG